MINEREVQMALTLARALAAATRQAAGADTRLVSITCDLMERAALDVALEVRTHITRSTRTLVFAGADLRDETGGLVMTASAVYKVLH